MIELLQPLADRLHILTADNGKEFADIERIFSHLPAKFFFTPPYAAWERGKNENMNSLIRKYIPKTPDFTAVTNEHLIWIMDRILSFLWGLYKLFNEQRLLHKEYC